MSVVEYAAKFAELAKFYPHYVEENVGIVFSKGLFAFQLWVLKSFFENSSSTLVSDLKSV